MFTHVPCDLRQQISMETWNPALETATTPRTIPIRSSYNEVGCPVVGTAHDKYPILTFGWNLNSRIEWYPSTGRKLPHRHRPHCRREKTFQFISAFINNWTLNPALEHVTKPLTISVWQTHPKVGSVRQGSCLSASPDKTGTCTYVLQRGCHTLVIVAEVCTEFYYTTHILLFYTNLLFNCNSRAREDFKRHILLVII